MFFFFLFFPPFSFTIKTISHVSITLCCMDVCPGFHWKLGSIQSFRILPEIFPAAEGAEATSTTQPPAHVSRCWMKAAHHNTFLAPSQVAPSPWAMSAPFASFCRAWSSCTSSESLWLGKHGKGWALDGCLGLMGCSISHHQQYGNSAKLTSGFLLQCGQTLKMGDSHWRVFTTERTVWKNWGGSLGHRQHWCHPSQRGIKGQ